VRETIRARRAPTVKRRVVAPPPGYTPPQSNVAPRDALGGVMPTAFGEP
jgi:hypothetical protein